MYLYHRLRIAHLLRKNSLSFVDKLEQFLTFLNYIQSLGHFLQANGTLVARWTNYNDGVLCFFFLQKAPWSCSLRGIGQGLVLAIGLEDGYIMFPCINVCIILYTDYQMRKLNVRTLLHLLYIIIIKTVSIDLLLTQRHPSPWSLTKLVFHKQYEFTAI